MALQRTTLSLDCSLLQAGDAVAAAISAMGMKVTSAEDTADGFHRSGKEKVNWLSSKWPFHVDVVGRPAGDAVLVEVVAGASSSIGAKGHVERKLGQFVELIETHSGSAGEPSATE
jgi:hypothetical protein